MKIINGTDEIISAEPTAVAIGKFDGVHRGHKALLQELMRQKKNGLLATVLTFDPSPEAYFARRQKETAENVSCAAHEEDGCQHRRDEYRELMTLQEKRAMLERMGIDLLVELPMNEVTAAMEPEVFVRRILAKGLKARFIAAGPDLSFGDRGRGNFELLDRLSDELGYETKRIDKIQYGEVDISSSLIRSLVTEGQMEEATACLGHPYPISGRVQHGQELGRTIGIPTVNLIPEEDKLLPPFGVYYSNVRVYWNGAGDPSSRVFHGMTNVGVKPTVTGDGEGERKVTVETHLFDYSGDLYGQEIDVSLLSMRRPEKRFGSVLELKAAMQEDIAAGRAYFDAIARA